MTKPKVDLRVQRTRKFIMDSFIELSESNDFKKITIKDITTKAMINRATFYYHFEDIYDLLDKTLSEVLLINLDCKFYQNNDINEETLINIFLAITNFQKSLANRCHVGYEETIARIIKEQLEVIFYKMLLQQNNSEEDEALKVTAVVLSWGVYGASVQWRRTNSQLSPEEFIKLAIPYLVAGTDILTT